MKNNSNRKTNKPAETHTPLSLREQIGTRAYQIWIAGGGGHGSDLQRLPRQWEQTHLATPHKQQQRETSIRIRRFYYENRNYHRTHFARINLRCVWLKHVLA